MNKGSMLMGALAVSTITTGAMATYTTTQSGAAAPTYATTLTFDEVGGPVGTVPTDSWAGIGLASIISGAGDTSVGDNDTPNGGWGLGTGNSFYGPFGVFMTFGTDLDAMSFQAWDPSGAPGPFGGGAAVVILDDGVEVGSLFFEPAWGGIGDTWINIEATGGMVFDEVRVLGFGFFPTTVVDNLSWNAVPAPSACGVLAIGAMAALRRRR